MAYVVCPERDVVTVEDAVAEMFEVMADECRRASGPPIGTVCGDSIMLFAPGFRLLAHYRYRVGEAGLEVRSAELRD